MTATSRAVEPAVSNAAPDQSIGKISRCSRSSST
jgi:hypothetical protein